MPFAWGTSRRSLKRGLGYKILIYYVLPISNCVIKTTFVHITDPTADEIVHVRITGPTADEIRQEEMVKLKRGLSILNEAMECLCLRVDHQSRTGSRARNIKESRIKIRRELRDLRREEKAAKI